MADLKISKKHHPSGSLARRILTVAVLLLVIPLFLQSLFLYRQEYKEKLDDVEEYLKVLGKERAHFIKELIQMNWMLLDAAMVPKMETMREDPLDGECEAPCRSFSTEGICAGPNSPNPETGFGDPNSNVKRLYVGRIPMPSGAPNRFIFINKKRNAFLIGKRESNANALVILVPFTSLAKEIPSIYPIRFRFVDDKGKTLWENRKFDDLAPLVETQEPIAGTKFSFQLAVEKEQIHGLHASTYFSHFAALVFFVGVIGGGAVYLFTRRISRPLKDLCKTMERVSEGAIHARYTPDRMGFEIDELGRQFNETLDALFRHAQEAERERLKREKLSEELRIGHEIQANLLPLNVPGLPGVDIATGYFASKEVNGDFYDLFRLENGQLLIAVCDTAGKGISACLFSLGLRSMVRSLASLIPDVAELVRRVNDLYLVDAHESAMFSTLWLGLYDPREQRLVYCSQGHPPALLRRNDHLQELWTGGIALGAQKIDVIPTKEIFLEKGDLLILYTDGVIEAHDPDGQLFGKKRLHEFVLRKKKETSQQIADQLIEEVHLFSQGAPQHDDITLVVFRISG